MTQTQTHTAAQSVTHRGWVVARELMVAVFLIGTIVTGCYTLLLVWPLTQEDAKLELGGRCDGPGKGAGFFIYDRVIYAMVLHPCQNHTEESLERALASAMAPGAPAEPPEEGEETDEEAGADTNTVADPRTDPDPAIAANTANSKAQKTPPNRSFAPSREPNALFLAVLAAGMTGGAVYSLRQHALHVARRSHDPSWTMWNISRPLLGAALAVLLFFLIRAGFVDTQQGDALKPEGFIALGGLVGLFTDQAWARMRIVAESVFAKRDEDTRSLDDDHTPPQPEPEPGRPGQTPNEPAP